MNAFYIAIIVVVGLACAFVDLKRMRKQEAENAWRAVAALHPASEGEK